MCSPISTNRHLSHLLLLFLVPGRYLILDAPYIGWYQVKGNIKIIGVCLQTFAQQQKILLVHIVADS